MFKRFDYAVGRSLGDGKSFCDASAALMVGAVHDAGSAVETTEGAPGDILYRMELVAPDMAVGIRCRQVADDSSAEIDVDDLQAAADAEDRTVLARESVEQGKLGVVKRRIDVDIRVAAVRLSQPGGGDIASARQQEGVESVRIFRAQADLIRDAEAGQRVLIIFRSGRYPGDEDVHTMTIEAFLYHMASGSEKSRISRRAAKSGYRRRICA